MDFYLIFFLTFLSNYNNWIFDKTVVDSGIFLLWQFCVLWIEIVLFLSNPYAFCLCCFTLFFGFAIALTRTSSTVLSRSSENGHLCLIHYLRGIVFSPPLGVVSRIFLDAFYQVEKVLCLVCREFVYVCLNHEWVVYFIRVFSCTHWDDHSFVISMWKWKVTLIDF